MGLVARETFSAPQEIAKGVVVENYPTRYDEMTYKGVFYMNLINKLEKTVLGWVKNVPHLPVSVQKWLAVNVWWIALVGAILSGLATLFALIGLSTLLSLIGSVSSTYYVTGTLSNWAIVSSAISIVFLALVTLVYALAVKPLQNRQKKGWVLLFLSWIINGISVVVSSVLSMSVVGFIIGIMFGAIYLAISGYFIFEIHGQYAHVPIKAKK